MKPALWLYCACVFWSIGGGPTNWQGNQTVELGTVVSRSLSGHVGVGPPEVAVRGITVELCSSDWKRIEASTKTDKNGRFSLGNRKGTTFYLRLSMPGLNTTIVTVRLDKNAPDDLRVHMSVAT